MLPPKLAKIMVNLAGGSSSSGAGRSREVLDNARTITILDPFCGSGTILQEALLLGYNVIGADKSPSAVKDTEKNIRWLQNNFPVSQCPSFRVIQSDIRKLENYVSPFSIDAIVTEPLLGPAFRATPTAEGLKPTLDALTALSTDAFAVFEQLVRPGGHVVMIFPVFQTTPPTFLSRRVLPRIGWTIAHPLPEEFRRHSALTLTPSSMLLYGRPGQHVWREIGIFARSAKNN
ncbi:methyltransferase domain-containing protein [Candidatus Uhrbacteria bacterium]|nr:methyltransferase domain-containing protein [Candidatus Uhrbacteria bacterium]